MVRCIYFPEMHFWVGFLDRSGRLVVVNRSWIQTLHRTYQLFNIINIGLSTTARVIVLTFDSRTLMFL